MRLFALFLLAVCAALVGPIAGCGSQPTSETASGRPELQKAIDKDLPAAKKLKPM